MGHAGYRRRIVDTLYNGVITWLIINATAQLSKTDG